MVKSLLGIAFPLMVFEMKVDVGGYGSETKAQRDQGCEPHGAIIFKSRLDSLLVEKTLAMYSRSRGRKWTEAANIVDVNNTNSSNPGDSGDTWAESPPCAAPLCPPQKLFEVPCHKILRSSPPEPE